MRTDYCLVVFLLALAVSALPPALAQDGASSPFDRKYQEWKGIVEDLRQLQNDYLVSKPADRKKLRKEFDDNKKKAEAMMAELRKLAEAEVKKLPKTKFIEKGSKNDAADFLAVRAKVFSDKAKVTGNQSDRFKQFREAMELAELLTEKGYNRTGVRDIAGVARFELAMLHDPDVRDNDGEPVVEEYLKNAEEHLKAAQDNDALLGGKRLDEVRDATKRLKAELARRKEQQSEDKKQWLPRVSLEIKGGKKVTVELFENEAPNTVAHFISLVEKGGYKGTMLFEVLPDDVIKLGNPKYDKDGVWAQKTKSEANKTESSETGSEENAVDKARTRWAGSLVREPLGNGEENWRFNIYLRGLSQKSPGTVFGRVIEGLDELRKVPARDPKAKSPPRATTLATATVLRKREGSKYEPELVGAPKPKKEEKKPEDEKKKKKDPKKKTEKMKDSSKTKTE